MPAIANKINNNHREKSNEREKEDPPNLAGVVAGLQLVEGSSRAMGGDVLKRLKPSFAQNRIALPSQPDRKRAPVAESELLAACAYEGGEEIAQEGCERVRWDAGVNLSRGIEGASAPVYQRVLVCVYPCATTPQTCPELLSGSSRGTLGQGAAAHLASGFTFRIGSSTTSDGLSRGPDVLHGATSVRSTGELARASHSPASGLSADPLQRARRGGSVTIADKRRRAFCRRLSLVSFGCAPAYRCSRI